MAQIEQLQAADRPFLTDGGLETWLFFQQGFEAPLFAAIMLMDKDPARQALRTYFDGFLAMAESAGTGFVLDTVTWRGCTEWAPKLDVTADELLRLSAEAVRFAVDIRDAWQARVPAILINGVVGPAGDGYAPEEVPDADSAFAMHIPQIRALAEAGADMISAITMTNVGEAIGVVRGAREVGLPVVISFTVETDGRLPSGDLLGDAIHAVDAATNGAPAYYMVNCAHPDHFRDTLAEGGDWTARIGGLRANASRLSHAELDEAEVLDDGDPEEFGRQHAELAELLPGLRVLGGCCGTDHRHVGSVSQHLHHA
ncbi:homocysteine S-methyltransferase family protein [Novosphingobium sp. G106]|uniref:homocysteine S-methyltransferase family protein n=1 Tax=Novosphingobium sp. G106 TaxID=2849500 RepID=UPI001C2CDEF9|nr:homocysteine S-methyltransferase family protein [Novosphingobium sp. G106]MBV1686977.1 homocysteine S-methyltransferase family protein [Novosphingobium sp. G106]